MLKKLNEQQLKSVVNALRDKYLYNWDTETIANGIQRVRVNEIGSILEVYIAPGLFATLCHIEFGNRTRKPFSVNGFVIKQWKHPKP